MPFRSPLSRNVTYNNGALALHLSSNELSEYINNPITDQADAVEEKIGGPQMSPKLYKRYLNNLHKRAQSERYMRGRLFGRFLPGKKGQYAPLKEDSALDFKPEKAPEPKPEVIPDDPLNTSMIKYIPKKWKKKKNKNKH